MSESISCCRFCTKLFLVLLRIAIGWHLLYEGLYKLETQGTPREWSSESYLRGATGPLAEHFRAMVEEPAEGWPFDEQTVFQRWRRYVDRFAAHFQLDAEQRQSARAALDSLQGRVRDEFFGDPQIQGVLKQYREDRERQEGGGFLSGAESSRLQSHFRLLSDRIDEYRQELEQKLQELLTDAQRQRGPLPRPGMVDRIDQVVMWGLVGLGAALLVGLFSRLAALGAAVLLAMFYLSMPPLPGLPGAIEGDSHYLYVNKNLVEMLAALVLATTHSGQWAGLDALVRGFVTRPLMGVGRKESH